ncbi:hypothetical protein CDAR_308911 [Caerostris darwini]|uniref:Uncharacterized protein n=1 Tax=Caerostris darwini TaxID=1538125 RepID=A0AAV4U5P0_9ARAC|nr:hypothetical protein CDAR_308911 [Caerostris darwini]
MGMEEDSKAAMDMVDSKVAMGREEDLEVAMDMDLIIPKAVQSVVVVVDRDMVMGVGGGGHGGVSHGVHGQFIHFGGLGQRGGQGGGYSKGHLGGGIRYPIAHLGNFAAQHSGGGHHGGHY